MMIVVRLPSGKLRILKLGFGMDRPNAAPRRRRGSRGWPMPRRVRGSAGWSALFVPFDAGVHKGEIPTWSAGRPSRCAGGEDRSVGHDQRIAARIERIPTRRLIGKILQAVVTIRPPTIGPTTAPSAVTLPRPGARVFSGGSGEEQASALLHGAAESLEHTGADENGNSESQSGRRSSPRAPCFRRGCEDSATTDEELLRPRRP